MYLRNLRNPDHPGTYIHPVSTDEMPMLLISHAKVHHLAVSGAGIEREDVLRLLRGKQITILLTERGYLVPARHLTHARSLLRDLLPDAQYGLSEDSGALITLIGMDLDLAPLVESRLARAQIAPLRLLKTCGAGPRWYISALVSLNQLELAAARLRELIRL